MKKWKKKEKRDKFKRKKKIKLMRRIVEWAEDARIRNERGQRIKRWERGNRMIREARGNLAGEKNAGGYGGGAAQESGRTLECTAEAER